MVTAILIVVRRSHKINKLKLLYLKKRIKIKIAALNQHINKMCHNRFLYYKHIPGCTVLSQKNKNEEASIPMMKSKNILQKVQSAFVF